MKSVNIFRNQNSGVFAQIKNSLISVLVSIFIVSLLLGFRSDEPLQTVYDFFILPFTNSFYFGNLLDTASLILLCALGFLLPSKLGFFNLGGEGQIYIASLVAVQFALNFHFIPQPYGQLAACFAAFFAAAVLGLVAIILKIYLNINELISTYLFSSAVIPLLDYCISEFFRDGGGNLLATPYIGENWEFLPLLEPSSLNISFVFVLLISLVIFVILNFTRQGYEIRVAGDNPEFAFSQGIKLPKIFILTVSLSTGLYGLAGAFAVYGSQHYVYSRITSGLAWSGISAALIGQSNPIGAIFGAFIFAWIDAGSKSAMIHSNFSFELSSIIQGVIFLLITLNFFKKRGRKKAL